MQREFVGSSRRGPAIPENHSVQSWLPHQTTVNQHDRNQHHQKNGQEGYSRFHQNVGNENNAAGYHRGQGMYTVHRGMMAPFDPGARHSTTFDTGPRPNTIPTKEIERNEQQRGGNAATSFVCNATIQNMNDSSQDQSDEPAKSDSKPTDKDYIAAILLLRRELGKARSQLKQSNDNFAQQFLQQHKLPGDRAASTSPRSPAPVSLPSPPPPPPSLLARGKRPT